jgi:PAS domain S-box-containing protein
MDNKVFRQLVEVSSDVATIIDPEGTITYVSPSVSGVLGYETDELVGEEGYEYQHPDDRQAVADAIERLQEDPDRVETIETRFRRADDSWCWIEATLQNYLDDPNIEGILVNSRDISERKRSEQQYRQLATEYETLMQTVQDCIFLLNVEQGESGRIYRFERLNAAYESQTGITTKEVKGKTPTQVFGSDLGAQLEANYRRCARAKEPIQYQEEVPVESGARFWQTSVAPVMAAGEVTRIIGITRNVTERVEREQEVQRQKDRLDEFASVVSHDLRNPLNIAQGRAGLLGEECESDHFEPLDAALDRMSEIITDTLTLARQGEVVGETESINLTEIVGACWKNVATGAASVDVVDEMIIEGDRGRLQHLFENLFRNAIEHGTGDNHTGSEDAGQTLDEDLSIRVGQIDDAGFYVEDSGTGIPKESRDEVFEPGHSTAEGGTGFGLTIVKRVAEAHGWEATITEGHDGGARFEFTGLDFPQQ